MVPAIYEPGILITSPYSTNPRFVETLEKRLARARKSSMPKNKGNWKTCIY
jgi:hypothetical protein